MVGFARNRREVEWVAWFDISAMQEVPQDPAETRSWPGQTSVSTVRRYRGVLGGGSDARQEGRWPT